MNALAQIFAEYSDLLIEGVRDTIVMTAVATLLAYVTACRSACCSSPPLKKAFVRTLR